MHASDSREEKGSPSGIFVSNCSHGRVSRRPVLQTTKAATIITEHAQTIYRLRARIEDLRTTFISAVAWYSTSARQCDVLPSAIPRHLPQVS